MRHRLPLAALCAALSFVASASAAPTITTVASAAVTLGGAINDTATIAGGVGSPSGTLTFSLYGPNDATCVTAIFTQTIPVAGNGSYPSAAFGPSTAGVYRWIASYSGDANNVAVPGNCNDANESGTVNPALLLAPASLPGGSAGSPYVQTGSASAGAPPPSCA